MPYLFGANQQLKHITESLVQMPLEHCQARGIHHSYRKPFPVSDQTHGKENFPDDLSEHALVELHAVSSCFTTGSQGSETCTSLSTFPPQEAPSSPFSLPPPRTRQCLNPSLSSLAMLPRLPSFRLYYVSYIYNNI